VTRLVHVRGRPVAAHLRPCRHPGRPPRHYRLGAADRACVNGLDGVDALAPVGQAQLVRA
jgi:hypothetical protein